MKCFFEGGLHELAFGAIRHCNPLEGKATSGEASSASPWRRSLSVKASLGAVQLKAAKTAGGKAAHVSNQGTSVITLKSSF